MPTPAPAPAPAPQQTGPVGTPSSDPTKTQPGETGPFDPNAEPPAPAPAPEPEAELAPPKPLPDTKEPAPEPEGITTFTFFRGDETGDANPAALYNRGESSQLSQEELKEYFDADGSGMLRDSFGTFSNYLAYMTEREQLIQSGDYDVGNWDEYTGSLTEDELMLLEGEDLTQYGDDAASDMPELEQRRLLEQSSAYDRSCRTIISASSASLPALSPTFLTIQSFVLRNTLPTVPLSPAGCSTMIASSFMSVTSRLAVLVS